MTYISLAIQCIFILVFLSPMVTNTIINPNVIDFFWILAILSGIWIGIYTLVNRFKTKFDFKSKLTIGLGLFLLVFYILGLGLDRM